MAWNIIAYIIEYASAWAAAHFVYMCFFKPAKFNELSYRHATGKFIQSGWLSRLSYYAYFLLVLVGIGGGLFLIGRQLFSWMPRSWRSGDDDGGIWAANGLAGLAAICGAAVLLNGMNKVAAKLEHYDDFISKHKAQ